MLPGSYRSRCAPRAANRARPSKVDPDPAFPLSDAERQARFTFLTDALSVQADLTQAGNAIRSVRDQLTALQEQLKRQPLASAPVAEAAAPLIKTLTDLQARVGGAGGGGGGEEGGGGGGGGG